MCGTCGCGEEGNGGTRIALPETGDATTQGRPRGRVEEHPPGHSHDRTGGEHVHPKPASETITLEQRVLAKNDDLAARNREWLACRGIVAVNLMSSPGAGKTTLLERTIGDLAGRRPVSVVEGDQETMLDADRIRRAGCPVIQVNTGAGCHLDAEMMHGALTTLSPESGSLILVENVGNLVCPALFDLGERSKVVIISVTEGTDKPLKYPYMFAAADLVIINKIDLLPYVDFDVEKCEAYARSVNPQVRLLAVSATTGEGMNRWYEWVAEQD
ncbi:hydrogenase nickel incorporation protein HypB [Streptomyces sp. H27-C3]|uniref:hydrogenase nickel incorporation protein HypB n=1 Tax=Streptomyces sp. H27-C3 TaxID=3046305 RepID=UPI0024B8A37C|nr:hydrogenase nickel incorporation protein HypB [Streptomyces sp. H27-C3]MDJ0464250.1 hydrogenase nickel incorporation protein HypB [Streptomyces sp. H27-C3]